MIIIPEIETVVILVPRTGSGTLRRAVAARYPRSMMIYRHMEADGVPPGYDRWRRVGVVRNPIARLWSLYNFIKAFEGGHDPAYLAAQQASVARPFDEWITDNQVTFTSPYDSAGLGRFWPQFNVRHSIPENRKSQHHYLRPDLGTEVWRFTDLPAFGRSLDVDLSNRQNVTGAGAAVPAISDRAMDHMRRFFAWDFEAAA